MSYKIQPLLVENYEDYESTRSAQGCFTGSDYWEAERATDKALQAERNKRAQAAALKKELEWCESELQVALQRKHKRKAERLQQRIQNIQTILEQ